MSCSYFLEYFSCKYVFLFSHEHACMCLALLNSVADALFFDLSTSKRVEHCNCPIVWSGNDITGWCSRWLSTQAKNVSYYSCEGCSSHSVSAQLVLQHLRNSFFLPWIHHISGTYHNSLVECFFLSYFSSFLHLHIISFFMFMYSL